MHSEKFGTGSKQIIALHGWGQSMEVLRPLAQILSRDATVHLIDLPGFGKSAPPEDVWSSVEYADAIHNYLMDQRIQTASFIGHSFGGKVAISFAEKYRGFIEKLILVGASGLKRRRTLIQRWKMLGIKYLGKGIRLLDRLTGKQWFECHFAPRFGSADYRLAGNMRPVLVKSVNEDLTPVLKKLNIPTLLLWGGNDQETPVEVAQRMQACIKDSQLIILPAKGHYLLNGVGAHVCARYIEPFLIETKNA